jgi:uncharacterized protein YndB with AHSA1/START domain
MGVSEHSVWVEADPDAVWRVYADPSRIPDWQTGRPVVTVTHGRGDEVGSTFVSRRGPLSARSTVVEARRPHLLVTSTDAYPGMRLEVTSRLEAGAGGTRVDLHSETHWPRGLGTLGRLIELAILNPREIRKELANLKRLVEDESP